MLLVKRQVVRRPVYVVKESERPNGTIRDAAVVAALFLAGIGMHKNLDLTPKAVFEGVLKMMYFLVYLIQFPVVGQRQMAVDVQIGAVLLHAQVMDINPVSVFMNVQQIYDPVQVGTSASSINRATDWRVI